MSILDSSFRVELEVPLVEATEQDAVEVDGPDSIDDLSSRPIGFHTRARPMNIGFFQQKVPASLTHRTSKRSG
jgi:hypothetical protein